MKAWFDNYMNGAEGKLYICPHVRRCMKNGFLSGDRTVCRHAIEHEFKDRFCNDGECQFTFSDGDIRFISVHCIEVRSKVPAKTS